MLSEELQRIVGYFLDEAAEHLHTLEQGLLNLPDTVQSSQRMHQLIRAAHSLKGGASMLGYSSIQRFAHRLEDYLKLLRECPIAVDRRLQSLFEQVFDTLVSLIQKVSQDFGLDPATGNQIVSIAEALFDELDAYLRMLIPTRLTVRATTDEHLHILSGYCSDLSRFSGAIATRVGLLGGTITRNEQEESGLRASIDIYLPPYSRLESIRQAIELSGAQIGTVQTQRDYSIMSLADFPVYRKPIERPATCRGCRYYYGRSDGGYHLNCAVHPLGPEAENCRDREVEN